MAVESSLLLDLPIPFKQSGDGYLVEVQALNGLRCWSDNFERITVCAPVVHDFSDSSIVWCDPKELLHSRNIKIEPLPMGYHPIDFIKYKKYVYKKLSLLVDNHNYLCFSNIGGIGSWGNLGVDIANRQGRKYALWFDWVLDQMPAKKNQSFVAGLKNIFDERYSKFKTYQAIRNCSLGLFHGKTVYNAYAPYCKVPQLVHDIHLSESDAISDKQLNKKLKSVSNRNDIKIGYVGRAHPMKAPEDWIEIVCQVCKQLGNDRVNATWFGDGPLLDSSRQLVEAKGLTDVVKFKGFASNRNEILNFLQEIDVFLFCHVTPESPRCLIEALISGTPIVGYKSDYATDLVGDRGGAIFAEIGDINQLSDSICILANNRNYLSSLIHQASQNKSIYSDRVVFEHRSALIKSFL